MADINIPQAEADALIAMEKHRVDEKSVYSLRPANGYLFP